MKGVRSGKARSPFIREGRAERRPPVREKAMP